MSPFVTEFAKKLAEKWFSLLVLPGALLLGTTTVGLALGQRSWSDGRLLLAQGDQLTAALAARPVSATVVAVLALLVGAAGAGVLATALGAAIGRLWSGRWPWGVGWLAQWRRDRRAAKFAERRDSAEAELARLNARPRDPGVSEIAWRADLDRLTRRRDAVALVEPTRATWMGDRMAAVQWRILAEYSLDVVTAWPRLWLLLPADRRAELRAAADAVEARAALAGWGVLYVAVGGLWWPSAIAGLLTCITAWYRGRIAVDSYAALVEATVDLHMVTLGQQLGVPTDVDASTLGLEIDSRVKKGS